MRQQLHRINSCFRWGAEPVTRQLSGGTATVATWCLHSLLLGTRVTYVTETTVLPDKVLRQFSTNWARSWVRRAVWLTKSTPCREKRSSALARIYSFPNWPEGARKAGACTDIPDPWMHHRDALPQEDWDMKAHILQVDRCKQSRGRMHSKMRFYVNILNGSLWSARIKTRRSKIGLNPPFFLGTMK